MANVDTKQFTRDHIVLDDGTVSFKCSSDQDTWPWLALPPSHPIVVQTINYYASVETGAARGTFDTTKWSALTGIAWQCGKKGMGHATHGIADPIGVDESPRYQLTFFDAEGSLVYRMSGTGVVFKTRDFEAWRDKAKKKITTPPIIDDFQYASPELVGVASQRESFLSPLTSGEPSSAQALITKENGLMPAHPYHSGSGDHVNANHLADVGIQFAHLLSDDAPLTCIGGEMSFTRYVELGRPFRIERASEDSSKTSISMTVHQADRVCSTMTLKFDRG